MIISIIDKCSTRWPSALFANLVTLFFLGMLVPAPLAAQASNGFTIAYQDSWPANSKIRFIRVVITPVAGVSPSDQNFQVVAKHDNYNSGVIATTTIPIRKGDTSAVGEIYIPFHNGCNFSLHTELDGDGRYNRGDFALSTNYEYNANRPVSNFIPRFVLASSEVINDQNTQFNVLDSRFPRAPITSSFTATKKFPALDDLADWYKKSNYNGDRNFMTFGSVNCERAAAVSLSSLPSKWFGYEGLEAVMITCDDLALLAQKHPGKLLAIERWVAASGRLIVLNCGNQLQRCEEVLKRLGDDNQQTRSNRSCRYPKSKLATESQIQKSRKRLGFLVQNGGHAELDWSRNLGKVPTKIARKKFRDVLALKNAPSMISIEFEQGAVVCLSDKASDWSDQKSGKEIDQWGEVAVFLGATRKDSIESGLLDVDFNELIGFPEFAEPPRYVFEFSIMAYLLLVGPIAFLILKKFKRLNMMFVLVPAVSFVVCSSILGWAIFAEGFETRINHFSFTQLNQTTGRQTTSTLSHIYSGVTPSPYRLEGATYGIVNLPRSGRFQRFDWDQNGEGISGGEIRARTNHQLRTLCSNETDQKLEFSFQSSGDSELATLRNGFDTTMACVIFAPEPNRNGEVWVAESVAPSATVQAKLLPATDAAILFRELLDQRSKSTSPNKHSYGLDYWHANIDVSDNYQRIRSFGIGTLNSILQESGDKAAGYLALAEGPTNLMPLIENASPESEIHIIRGVR